MPEPIKNWSLTSLKEKLIKIGAKVVSHGRYVAFQTVKSPGTFAGGWRPRLARWHACKSNRREQ